MARGQSMVEFALVLPLLLILLLGIADFGRIFAAGITLEAAARDAAEVVAEQYRRQPPDGPYADQTLPAPLPASSSYYLVLHDLAAAVACREAGQLDNATYDGANSCAYDASAGEQQPIISVCIHDGADPLCGQPSFGATVPPAGDPDPCSLRSPPTNDMVGYDSGTEDSRYVEVRLCYRFSMLMRVPPLPIGDIWMQKNRVFTVAYFPPPPTPSPPSEPSPPPAESLPPDETPTPSPSESDSPTPSPSQSEAPTPSPSALETPSPVPSDTPTASPSVASP